MIKLNHHHQCSAVMGHYTGRLKSWAQFPALTLTNSAWPTLGVQYLTHKMKGQDGWPLRAFLAPRSMAMLSVKGHQATTLYSPGCLYN